MIRTAAAVLLLRESEGRLEVFIARRSPKLRFLGGFWAFPGGVLEKEDADLEACARRELVEETGLALEGKTFDAVGRFLTPPFAPVRYDTVFFSARVGDDARPVVDGGELVDGGWFAPEDACARWREGTMPIAPPVLFVLERLAESGAQDGLRRVGRDGECILAGELPPVRFSPGIEMASLKTPTLPPATTTNTYLVGAEDVWIVDPATPDVDEQERLLARLERRLEDGATLRGVLLTHHHEDHVGAAVAVARRFGLEARGHARTLDRAPDGLPCGAPLEDGDTIELGRAPDGSPDWRLEALFTPGHAQGHLCFRESRYRALLAGDMVSTVSTIVIDPPEGHLSTYLESLTRLADDALGVIYPAHGPPFPFGTKIFRRYLAHRAEREAKLVAALGDGVSADDLDALVARVYDDVAPEVWPLAKRSLVAGLEKLREE